MSACVEGQIVGLCDELEKVGYAVDELGVVEVQPGELEPGPEDVENPAEKLNLSRKM